MPPEQQLKGSLIPGGKEPGQQIRIGYVPGARRGADPAQLAKYQAVLTVCDMPGPAKLASYFNRAAG
jgi:hypothetical protein